MVHRVEAISRVAVEASFIAYDDASVAGL